MIFLYRKSNKEILFHYCFFRLGGCNLSERCCQELLSGLSSSSSLREVDLSNNDLDVFDLKKYSASEETLLRLMPMLKASKKAL